MRNRLFLSISIFMLVTICSVGSCKQRSEEETSRTAGSVEQVKGKAHETVSRGESLFKLHCAACHRNGENVINPQKPLFKDARESYGIKTAGDIVELMRNPGPGMSTFDEEKISDADAKAIAEYILKTF